MAKRLQVTSQKVGDLAFDALVVLHSTIKSSEATGCNDAPDGMQIKITRQEIGQIVGCSRETVGRILKMLEEQT